MKNISYSFDVTVNDKSVHEYFHEGKTYIEGRRGSAYELSFKNHTSSFVLVILSVDSLNVLTGNTASDKSSGYVVDAFGSLRVPGWRINSDKVAAFRFRPQGDRNDSTYVEELRKEGFNVDTSNQGVIGCMVIKEKQKYSQSNYSYSRGKDLFKTTPLPFNHYTTKGVGSLMPLTPMNSMMGMNTAMACSSSLSFASSVREASLGTGFGEDKSFRTNETTFERESLPDWIAVINYDTLSNLRRRGVPIYDSVDSVAQAFPGYNSLGCHVPRSR